MDEVAVRHPLGRVDLPEWQQQQPRPGNVLRAQRLSVLLEQVQTKDRVVDVVVAGGAVDVAAGGSGPVLAQLEALGHRIEDRDVVQQRVGPGEFEVLLEVGGGSVRAHLHWLAEVAAGDPTQPGGVDLVLDVSA
ncbi:hypothetical protein ACQPWY_13675 [Pseudonocardia xinjiangensis]|uniref:hypothetical protein n=1 Tax=Pseudonocardia xinjiangensis TaxID=75289 RepID=UPI003D91C5D0